MFMVKAQKAKQAKMASNQGSNIHAVYGLKNELQLQQVKNQSGTYIKHAAEARDNLPNSHKIVGAAKLAQRRNMTKVKGPLQVSGLMQTDAGTKSTGKRTRSAMSLGLAQP